MKSVYREIPSPVGQLKLVASEKGLAAVLWADVDPKRVRPQPDPEMDKNLFLEEAEKQLVEYFRGERSQFKLKLDFVGTEFQKKVWDALLEIPFGETRTYAQIAKQIGHPKAVRAVGAANGKNPIAIIGPCHRVIGSSGKLTGYAGGLAAKAILLELEGVNESASSK